PCEQGNYQGISQNPPRFCVVFGDERRKSPSEAKGLRANSLLAAELEIFLFRSGKAICALEICQHSQRHRSLPEHPIVRTAARIARRTLRKLSGDGECVHVDALRAVAERMYPTDLEPTYRPIDGMSSPIYRRARSFFG